MVNFLLRRIFLISCVCITFSAARAQYVAIPDTAFGHFLSDSGYASCLIGNSNVGWQLDTTSTLVRTATYMTIDRYQISDLTGLTYFRHLDSLYCYMVRVTSLPPLPDSLLSLYCHSLPYLVSVPPLPATLISLDMEHCTQLSQLPSLPAGLTTFICIYDSLTSLPVLPSSLTYLSCRDNQLTSIPALPDSLISLAVNDNPNLYCLPRIPQTGRLEYLYIGGSPIHCLPNYVSLYPGFYDIDPSTLPYCDISSGCDYYYNIIGTTHSDTAATCLDDSLYPASPISNLKVLLKQNGHLVQQVFTDQFGQYSFITDSLTGYDVSIDTVGLPLLIACPAGGVRHEALSQTDSVLFGQGFGLTCSLPVDFGTWSISSTRFRPQFSNEIFIQAGNILSLVYHANCNNPESGIVTTTFSGDVHYAGPAPDALAPSSVSGNTLTYTISDLNTLGTGSLNIILTTDSNAQLGSSVCIQTIVAPATPDADPSDDTLIQCFTIVNSYDPNQKDVYPVSQIKPGDWLTYTIHFQNTGTDTAYRVVVRDTLSPYLDASSFAYLASSAPAIVQLMGNAVAFSFLKIDLADSTTDPINSIGWLQYKVKTLPGLTLGTQVQNTASIYFDYNPAVVTNTTVNTLDTNAAPLGIKPASSSSSIHLYPNPNKGSLTLSTSGSINSTYTISDMLGHIVMQHTITSDTEAIDLPAAAEGVYTLVVKGSQPIRFVVAR